MLNHILCRASALPPTKQRAAFICAFCQKRPLNPSGRTPFARYTSSQPVVTGDKTPSPELVRKIRAEIEAQINKNNASPKSPPKPTKHSAPTAPKIRKKRKAPGIPGRSLGDVLKVRPDTVVINADLEQLRPIHVPGQPVVPKLSHDLDRVLFNPGVYFLQDPRSRVYNFDPYLQNIMPVNEFDFESLSEYITSSRDIKLEKTAKELGKKYVGSTSSMTSVLSHFHYLLSAWRPINPSVISKNFAVPWKTFTALQRAHEAVFLRYKDGVYAVDADKEFDKESVLTLLGKSMEKLLTLPPETFEQYRRSNVIQLSPEDRKMIDTYHYSTLGDFLMRSQLDAYDPRLPGTGMFDLKTRAVVSIRMDVENFHIGSGYQIKDRFGEWESFEREYFDMIRAAFLKYSLQVRMGRMDGIFVAFHNTERIFGFQYITLEEMDASIHQDWHSGIGDREFRLSIRLLNDIFNAATTKFPEKSLRIHFETRETQTPLMYIFVEPMDEEGIARIQENKRTDMSKFLKELGDKKEAYLRSLKEPDEDIEATLEGQNEPTDLEVAEDKDGTAAQAEEEESEEEGTESDEDESIDSEEEGLDEAWLEKVGQESAAGPGELLAFTLKIKNMVNGKYVLRPDHFKPSDKWEVEYDLEEIRDARAWTTYRACQKRRELNLSSNRRVDGLKDQDDIKDIYIKNLREMSVKGREYLAQQEKEAPVEKIVWTGTYKAKTD